MTDINKLTEICELALYNAGTDPEKLAKELARYGVGLECKNMYLVNLKLTEQSIRGCQLINVRGENPHEYVRHEVYGWYEVRVFAENEEDAISRAKTLLAEHKNVKRDDFFENYEEIGRGPGVKMTCPECGKQYGTWSGLDYDVCPKCRRRCK